MVYMVWASEIAVSFLRWTLNTPLSRTRQFSDRLGHRSSIRGNRIPGVRGNILYQSERNMGTAWALINQEKWQLLDVHNQRNGFILV
jgi:hypothetical protein